MAGIVSYGAYVPIYRLKQQLIPGGRLLGERAVANFDEDSITMGVAAAMDCLQGRDAQKIDRLYFASTTMPYKEKQNAGILAMAAGLSQEISTMDVTDSLRAGTNAMKAALDAVKAGSAKQALVVAADCRPGAPGSELEQLFGDGAAALVVGDSGVIATIEDSYSTYDDIVDVWRKSTDDFVNTWEDRFIVTAGYMPKVQEAVSRLMKKTSLKASDFSKVVLYGPDPRTHLNAVTTLGFNPKTQVQDPLFNVLGNTGTAFALMLLVATLESAKAGDRILLVSYGDGCDAYVLKVTKEIETIKGGRGLKGYLASKKMLNSYDTYVHFRGYMPTEAVRRLPEPSFAPPMWRDRNQVLRLHGSKCRQCNTLQFPMQRVCVMCQAIDDFEEVRFAEKRGNIFTYTLDNLAATGDPPMAKAVIDFEGGGRMFCQITDRDPEEIKIGMTVEMTFRKISEGAGFHNYFWKCRPPR